MEITLHEITIRDLVKGYKDDGEGGVVGYDGKLDIRPPYQREFVYNDDKRDAVIETVTKKFPLNVMYWVQTGVDTYEVLDGQQRTISICQFYTNDFSVNFRLFDNLLEDEKEKFLDYKLMIYICEGEESEKLDWFKTINIAGERLTDQELRNAIYTGPFIVDAKRHFSKTNGPAKGKGGDYLNGTANRQDYLETALKWIVDRDGLSQIEEYMSLHQHDTNSNSLWLYFSSVIDWVEQLFPKKYYRREMKGQPWGLIYNTYKDNTYDAELLEEQVKMLMQDDEVKSKKGIYPYLFTGNSKTLNLRSFTASQKRVGFEKQNGICVICKDKFNIEEMEADHITPWSQGGKTDVANLQLLCRDCNRKKSAK